MTKQIAFFDFDGTITNKDTLFEFIKFCKGTFRYYLGFIVCSPILIAYKLRVISNQRAKEIVLRLFFGNTSEKDFNDYCVGFGTKIPALIRPKAINEIKKLQNKDFEVVIVSASPENWLLPWTTSLGLKLIATKMEVHSGKLTGNINGKNCHGDEKVCRIQAYYNLAEYDQIYAYGDTIGDLPMLRLANHSFYKPFR